MATLRRTFPVRVSPGQAWDAVRDFTALHVRLVPGFVVDCTSEEGGTVRVVTFGNGARVRERLVTRDDAGRRLVYTAEGGRASHYNAAVEVLSAPDGGARIVWTVDLLPDTFAPVVDGMMALGVEAMRTALGG